MVASRAAVLASLLPADADREKFLHVLGIHGDPVAAKKRIAVANRTGERLGADAYGYSRAFGYTPEHPDREWLAENSVDKAIVLDPTAGGGSVPFECVRLGLETKANDLNPVAALIERATLEWPTLHGTEIKAAVEGLGNKLAAEIRGRLAEVFPDEPGDDTPTRRVSLGAHGHLSVLRGVGAVIAELAAGAGWAGGPAQAVGWRRAGLEGAGVRVRDRQIGC